MKEKQRKYQHCIVQETDTSRINANGSLPMYSILVFQGKGSVNVDLATYPFEGSLVLFTTPYQLVHFHTDIPLKIRSLQFHGDFYCIEYHKKEVACNGLLFNNIYQTPYVKPDATGFRELNYILDKLTSELEENDTYSQAIVRAYLQLILALCSKIKSASMDIEHTQNIHHPLIQFPELLEKHFYEERQPAFYAAKMGILPNTFSKICKQHFLKTPSELIRERVILEAKKRIHLSHKNMKQIAAELHFDDEHYFSRYFKKHTGVTPTAFREHVGISIVADLSR